MSKSSLLYLFLLFSGLVASVLLVLSPMLVGALASFSSSANEVSVVESSIIAVLVVVSIFGAFLGGMLFVFTVRKIFEYKDKKSSNTIQPISYVGG